jgi:hypothetical protein
VIREEIAKRILGMIAAATIAGYGISEMDTFFQNNNHQNNRKIINETKTLVETILQKPENLLQAGQEQKKPELFLTSQFQYDENKPITKVEICSFYEDLKVCKEAKDEKETKFKCHGFGLDLKTYEKLRDYGLRNQDMKGGYVIWETCLNF